MKKLNIKLVATLLIVAVVASITIFYACTKEKEKIITPTHHEATVEAKDYESYIEELIAETGIDIYKLSELDEVQKVADKQIRMMNAFTATTSEQLHTKGVAFTDAKATQIQNLATSIETEYAAGNYGKVMVLYESLCNLCRSIDGFMFGVDEYGLQTVTYDPDKEPVQLPINYIQAEQATAVAMVKAIETANPQISTLPLQVRTEIVSATLYVGVKSTMMMTKQYSVEDCKKRAGYLLTASLTGLTVLYIAGAAFCTGTLLAVAACEAVAFASYMSGVSSERSLYNARVRLCELQGYY